MGSAQFGRQRFWRSIVTIGTLVLLMEGLISWTDGHSSSPVAVAERNVASVNNRVSPVGTNLRRLAYRSSQLPFVDVFKTASAWMPGCIAGQQPDCTAAIAGNTGEQLDLDANGWVRSLPQPGEAPRYWFVNAFMLNSIGDHYPSGTYVVLYDGQGTIRYGGAAQLVAHEAGRDILNVTPNDDGIAMRIVATDPNHTGDYIRNIRVLMPGFEQTYATQPFNPVFLEKIAPYRALRFMDWMATNDSAQGAWADRPLPTDATYATAAGAPLEIMVGLANQVGADPWFTIPHMADDDYIQHFATQVRDSLSVDLHVYVEYSNEVWNNGFSQAEWVLDQANATWPTSLESDLTKRQNWYGMRMAQICDIWHTVWRAQRDRVTCVMAGQAGDTQVIQQALACELWAEGKPCAAHRIQALAIAPYFALYIGSAANAAAVVGWTTGADGGKSELFEELVEGGLLADGPSGGALQQAFDRIDRHRVVAETYGLTLVAYEGGQHLVAQEGLQASAAISMLFMEANRDPRMELLYATYLDRWRREGGTLFIHHNDVGRYNENGSFGALEYIDQNETPKYRGLRLFIDANPCWWPRCGGGNTTLYLPLLSAYPVPSEILLRPSERNL
jgi:hypothetical protein